MSIYDNFENFNRNLYIPQTTIDSIKYRYERITQQLNLDFYNIDSKVKNSLYVGSYGRDTDIHVSDVDVLFQIPYETYSQYNSYVRNGQSALLQSVKNSIQKTYNTTHIKGDGQVVGLNFNDGINFEILPAVLLKDDKGFWYPDTNDGGSWKTTNPRAERKAIQEVNNITNKNLKRLCRMTRAWKYERDVPMGGLLIDTVCHNFILQWEHNKESYMFYDRMVRDFFEYLMNQKPDQTYWLAPGSNQKVYRKGGFEYKATQAYNLCLEAIEDEEAKYEYSANKKWREIFGNKF